MPYAEDNYRHHFEKIAHIALDWILCVGVVPVALVHSTTTNQSLPVVPQTEAVRLYVNMDDYGRLSYSGEFVALRSMFAVHPNYQRPAVMVWSGGSYLPTSLGRLLTPITHLESSERFMSIVRENALIASTLQCNPLMVSKSVVTKNSDQDGVMWNVDDATVQEAEYQRLRRVANNTRDEFDLHRAKWSDSGVPATTEAMRDFSHRCQPREYFIASDRDIVRPAEPVIPTFFADAVRQTDEKIFQIFGIPYAMFTNSGSQVSNSYMQIFALNASLKRVKNELERFLQEVHKLVSVANGKPQTLPESFCLAEMGHKHKTLDSRQESTQPEKHKSPPEQAEQAEQAKLSGAAKTEPDHKQRKLSHTKLHKARLTDPELVLPGVPCIQQADILQLVATGYMSDEEACNIFRTMIGLRGLSTTEVDQQVRKRKLEVVSNSKSSGGTLRAPQPPAMNSA